MAQETALGTDQLLPFERTGESTTDVLHKGLLAALESEDQPETDEPAAEEAPTSEAQPDDEAEVEVEAEAESEDESDEGEESDEDEAEEPAPEPLHEVIVDGKPQKVTLQEALAGYQREADYRRKTQALAEDRKKVESLETELRQVRDQEAQQLQALAELHAKSAPPTRDWAALRAQDPTQYAVEWAAYQQHREQAQAIEAEQKRVYEARLAEWTKQQEAVLQAETAKLHEAIPEWRDNERAAQDKAKLVDYVTQTYGWSTDDLASVTDHRLMVVLNKARLYDESQQKGQQTIKEKIKPAAAVMKPGTREVSPQKGKKQAIKQARMQLARTGRAEDAAALIEHMLDD